MYTIHTRAVVRETLILRSKFKYKKVIIEIHVDDILSRYQNIEKELQKAHENLKTNPGKETVTAFGQAARKALCVLFGECATKEIETFYNGRYMEMMRDLSPFIQNKIISAIIDNGKIAVKQEKRERK